MALETLPAWLLVHNDLRAVMGDMEGVLGVRRSSYGTLGRPYLVDLEIRFGRLRAGEGRPHPLSIALQQ